MKMLKCIIVRLISSLADLVMILETFLRGLLKVLKVLSFFVIEFLDLFADMHLY